ncbi:hypothetical protein HPP92_013868 [Vanilla planifolia]|uniref:Uncharacterized protein n=1 Tax=Vanilla planifolia TaxID=51239 RepID=A0A835R080_VANPL|nr:hypothetical protein HPP92_013868 [Vanilla planifolia]
MQNSLLIILFYFLDQAYKVKKVSQFLDYVCMYIALKIVSCFSIKKILKFY